MTKYILHGGYSREINSDNNQFFQEITSGLEGKVCILMNYFAREENPDVLFEKDAERFIVNSQNKDLVFDIAKPETLAEQLEKADVMYIRGGVMDLIHKRFFIAPDLRNHLSNKVIAGSSAGAYILARYYWNNDLSQIEEGLGILNLKLYCHYKEEEKKNVEKLIEYKEELPLLTLRDYKWQVFYK